MLQSVELTVAAEELGADGTYFRVRHFARELASPFPLLAVVGARNQRIEFDTGVVDIRYKNLHYMVHHAGLPALILGRWIQPGISHDSPEQVIDNQQHFGYVHHDGRGRSAPWRPAN